MKRLATLLLPLMMYTGTAGAQGSAAAFETPAYEYSSHKEDVTTLMFTPDKKNLVSASRDKTIKFYGLDSGQEVRTLAGHAMGVLCLAFSKDGKFLLSGSDDGSAYLWNMEGGQVLQRFRNHTAKVNAVAISQDAEAKYLYTAGNDGKIQVYDRPNSYRFVRTITIDDAMPTTLTFGPMGKNLYVGGSDGRVRVIDPAKGEVINTYDGHSDIITGLTFSADGKFFATSSNDRKVNYWDAASGTVLKTFEGHEWKVLGVDISKDGKSIASVSNDGTLRLWDISTVKMTKKINLKNKRTFYAVVFHPEMKYVISGMQVKDTRTPAIMWWNLQ